ncbi:hypothetical protein PJE062_5327 [Pseudovibrio sp. JE062]|nr:hypothetical protein PJE062_5327 [Pseudovibrio sp. JE062]
MEEFIAAIENDDWSDDEKFAICSLVVSSFEDFVLLRRDSSGVDDLYDKVMKYEKRSDLNIIYSDAEIAVWKRIHSAINQDKDLYSAIIEYWKIEEESSQIFSLTPLFRSFF